MFSFNYGLFVAITIFCIGVFSLCIRRNLLFILISLEIMINAVSLALILISANYSSIDGQIMYIVTLTVAAIESSIGLTLLIRFYKIYNTLNIDLLSEIQ
ncbi:NADH-quinone oxidoreductase subunit NuoK [Buchnera aphidicola (Thelaxes californica)]|uniref:NADH-quinone oxidoreductase subunit K n=1 Tax=Buchnera aphidicola (Thelaxes californica) TaxID=1315998 RepID=A0A4D6YF44_9GAMM|nr:NADH-quinone oxidoreductase subunit NuoK [Buchnera aphidicola]QCI26683.1 NADH-quinone oxidoreductase subunit NuoK [Buchnera aphidicola (Thelaxes californica)]